jgi:glutathione S-transferase
MALTLHFHPLASFCWKVLIALYETEAPFESVIVDLGEQRSRAAFLKLSPLGKMPVLVDTAREATVPESTIIIEYLATHYPGRTALIPADADIGRDTRLADRFYDLYVHEPMQKIVGDRLRATGQKDPFGVGQARATLATAYAMIDEEMASKGWAAGDSFTLADCAAFPALFYANNVAPFPDRFANLAGYFERLSQRPSVQRVVHEAEPYFALFPDSKEA